MCGGFWPADQKLYLTDKAEYFRRLDQVVHAAEEAHIGLIPSLFWNAATVPDLVGEPLDQLGNPQSRSVAYIRKYTEDVVRRYKNSPTLWGWEFGNEYTLASDLPNASEHRPAVWPQLGTPKERTARDELASQELHVAFVAFAKTVRRFDSARMITTGNAIPRVSAFHNSHGGTWESDTAAQFAAVCGATTRSRSTRSAFIFTRMTKTLIPEARPAWTHWWGWRFSRRPSGGKPLFVGEFGAAKTLGAMQERARFQELLSAIVKNRVPLSAFWVFDMTQQDADWNVTTGNDRAYMLSLVEQANTQLQAVSRK